MRGRRRIGIFGWKRFYDNCDFWSVKIIFWNHTVCIYSLTSSFTVISGSRLDWNISYNNANLVYDPLYHEFLTIIIRNRHIYTDAWVHYWSNHPDINLMTHILWLMGWFAKTYGTTYVPVLLLIISETQSEHTIMYF